MIKQADLNASAQGLAIAPEAEETAGSGLKGAISEYIEQTRLSKKKKTLSAYPIALRYFGESCAKLCLENSPHIHIINNGLAQAGRNPGSFVLKISPMKFCRCTLCLHPSANGGVSNRRNSQKLANHDYWKSFTRTFGFSR